MERTELFLINFSEETGLFERLDGGGYGVIAESVP